MSAYRSEEDRDIADILGTRNTELRRDAGKRRELAAAVRRKDDSAIRRVANAVWQGIKFRGPVRLVGPARRPRHPGDQLTATGGGRGRHPTTACAGVAGADRGERA